MQITSVTAVSPVSGGEQFPGGVNAAVAAVNDVSGAISVGQQLLAYQNLTARWREADPRQRAGLDQAITNSPFAQKVQATLNAFTRAAWAGPDAVPPNPQLRALDAFDRLSETDQQIVAAMQAKSARLAASPRAYRNQLQAALEATQGSRSGVQGPIDTVTLSDAAKAHLAGEPLAGTDTNRSVGGAVSPHLASAIAAYSQAG